MKQVYLGPTGDPNATIAIIGDQPDVQEIRNGKIFSGQLGQVFSECLSMAKIPRQGLYITNVIKDLDQPLTKYINLNSKGQYTISKHGYLYIQELALELAQLKNLNIIVPLGDVPLIATTNRTGISKWRGSVINSSLLPGTKVLPTFHPSSFIPPKGFNHLNKPMIITDLIQAKYESTFHEIKQLERHVTIKPTFQKCIDSLNYIYEIGCRGKTIDIDIEVINGELDSISFARDPQHSISIPFTNAKGDYFHINQEYEILLLIAKIIQSKRISKRGANFIFDTQFLYHKYGMVPRGNLHCTQIAQKIMLPDFPAGLDFVTTMHTDIPYYKADGKQWIKAAIGTWDNWWAYNGMDAIATSAAHPQQLIELEKQGNIEPYNHQRALIKPLTYMSERGIKVDIKGMLEHADEERAKQEILLEKLHEIVGYEINPNSPKQLQEYFYNELGIKPYKKRNTKGDYNITTDVDAMKRISRRGFPAAQIILDIRGATKRISTYLDISKVDKDGRYRSSYKPVGAETGRLASGETIFGTGGNQQNWPHDLLRFFVFDEGYIGYSIDLSQIENRVVAYVGGVITQIEAFENGIDMHKMTASVILDKPYDDISSVEGSSPIGDGKKSERDWGKKGNHATNYDVQYKTFALKNEISEAQAKYILAKIHRGYPQIKNGYQAKIINMLKTNRTVVNPYGRSRLFLGPVHESYPTVSKGACMNTYRAAFAHFPQSTCADKIIRQGVNYIYYNQDLFKPVELLTQVHDSVVFQIPLSIPWLEHAKIIQLIKDSLETPIMYEGLRIDTPADIAIGLNMCKEEMIEIKSKNVPNSDDQLADKIKETYENLQRQSK